MEIEKTLKERKSNYGEFRENADVAQLLKNVMKNGSSWCQTNNIQREALDLIALKISRIVTGNPSYEDNWHDIAGYAKLVENNINEIRNKIRKVANYYEQEATTESTS